MKFYICEHCKNIIAFVEDNGVAVDCCNAKMKELVENTVDASLEKHVPVINVDGNKITVKVGEIAHPMLEEHYIKWIALETKQGNQRKLLTPGVAPECCFKICENDEVLKAYEYCNLHGLWVSDKVTINK